MTGIRCRQGASSVRHRSLRGCARAAAASLLAAVLAACAPLPTQPDREVPLPQSWRGAPAGAAATADPARWWRELGDPALDALVDAALAQNLGLAEAQHRLRAARAQSEATRLRFVPQLNARTLSAPNVESTASYFQVGFDASWELGLFGRRDAEKQVAAADVAQADADVAAARVSVVAETVRTYLELRAAQARCDVQRRQLAAAQATLQRARRLQALGLGGSTEVDKAQSAWQSEQARAGQLAGLPPAQAQALAQLLGRTQIDLDWLQPAPLPVVPAAAAAPAPAELLRTRPEIRRAEWAVERAAGELGIARAELWPQLNIGGSLTYASKLDGDELLPPTSIVSIGPMISIPLLDWGMRRAAAVAHGELLAAAVIRYRAAVVDGAAEVQNSLAALQTARERHAALAARVAEAPQQLARITRLQALGLADASGLAEAERAEIELDAERLDAQATALQALVALYKALGGAPPPLEAAP